MGEKLTKRQKAVMESIERCIQKKGYGPTVREICEDLGLSSPSTVHVHLKTLEQKGYIVRDPLKSRSISLPPDHALNQANVPEVVRPSFSKIVDVPLVGNVAAGEPILAEENITDTISLPTDIVGDAPSFMLSVRGDSMIEAGINDGDIAIIDRSAEASDGDVIVAFINNEFTIKFLDLTHKSEGYIELRPANKKYHPIRINDSDDFEVWGVVVWTIRNWKK